MEQFKGTILSANGKGAYVEIPFDVEKVFQAKRVKVKATFDGIDYRGSIVKMGGDCYVLGITKEIRSKLGKNIGDLINVTVTEDKEERVVELPNEIQEKINQELTLLENWNSYSYTNQRRFILWIDSAKKEETRMNRIEVALEKIRNKEIL